MVHSGDRQRVGRVAYAPPPGVPRLQSQWPRPTGPIAGRLLNLRALRWYGYRVSATQPEHQFAGAGGWRGAEKTESALHAGISQIDRQVQ